MSGKIFTEEESERSRKILVAHRHKMKRWRAWKILFGGLDTIEEIIDIKGIPVRIVDTAGIIEPRDLIEKKAVLRAKSYIDLADLVLLVFDASQKLSPDDAVLMAKLKNKTIIALINKIDLKIKLEKDKILKRFKNVIDISAKKSKKEKSKLSLQSLHPMLMKRHLRK